MTNIYKGQSAVSIVIGTGVNFVSESILSAKIHYIKPSEVTGSWDADVLVGEEASGSIYVNFTNDLNFDESGDWELKPILTYSDNRTGIGSTINYYVEE